MSAGIIHIAHLLSKSDLSAIHALLKDASFVDGGRSAGSSARAGKNNLEAELSADTRTQVDNIIMGRLINHPQYKAVLPAHVAQPLYAKYGEGMEYGEHLDNPLMGVPPHMYRSDLAATIFLSDIDAYDGGELVVNTASATPISLKYPAGDAVLYPATTLHRVAPVTKGERLVALTWVQSLVRDVNQRELLSALRQTSDGIAARMPNSPEQKQLEWIYANLVRLWAEH